MEITGIFLIHSGIHFVCVYIFVLSTYIGFLKAYEEGYYDGHCSVGRWKKLLRTGRDGRHRITCAVPLFPKALYSASSFFSLWYLCYSFIRWIYFCAEMVLKMWLVCSFAMPRAKNIILNYIIYS